MDERKTYYVAVGEGQVLEDKQAAAFEYEIHANEQEMNKLQEKFERMSSPAEGAADEHDRQMREIYKMLYQLGTDDTKRHIESTDIWQKSDEHD